LLRRAAETGAVVLEDAPAVNLLMENQRVCGIVIKHSGGETLYRAPLTIDATGRSRSLSRRITVGVEKSKTQRAHLVAFKTHLEGSRVAPGACEIYFYPGGYGGLSSIENGLSNLCFIASARAVRACGADPERVLREVVCQNRRAAFTLGPAKSHSPWLAVALEGFGTQSVTPHAGLLSIGDAASFIDPFTGSGMLMAMESGELAARLIGERLGAIRDGSGVDELARVYRSSYNEKFHSRLRICSVMRRAAFVPGLAQMAIRIGGVSDRLRRRISRATRGVPAETVCLPGPSIGDG
jgi:flavin-dependent dehydrogenase